MGQDWRAELARLTTQRGVARKEPLSEQPRGHMCNYLVTSVKEYALFMLDPGGVILTWSEGAHRIKQYREYEVVGQNFRMLYTPDDQAAGRPEKNLADAIKHGQTEDLGWRMKKDGSWFWADALITMVCDDDGKLLGFAKVIRDLTEVNKAEVHSRELEVSRQVDRLKNEFLSLISHELRTPLTTIQGYSDLIEDGSAGPISEAQQDFMSNIQKGTTSLTRLIDNLIEMTSIQAKTLQLDPAPMNFAEVALGVVYATQTQAQEKHLWLANHVSPDMPEIVADAQRVSQILLHLIDNAIKFTPRGGRVDIRASVDEADLRCEVSDTGAGIPQAAMETLFTRFSQGDMSSTRSAGGLGIGLSMAKFYVEAHGGEIGILSSAQKGSTFWFTLPRQSVASAGGRPVREAHRASE